MNKFLLKSSFFIGPFFLLYFITFFVPTTGEGDLVRLGYMYNNPSPKSIVMSKFSLSKKYTLLSKIDMKKDTVFSVLTIGDSFSEQDSLGYKNYLANEIDTSVLHVDRYISGDNPVQTLISLINGDVFDYIHIDYIVLQSVERAFVHRCQKIDYYKSIKRDFLTRTIANHKKNIIKQNTIFFSKGTLITPLINIEYLFSNKPYYSKTYRVLTNSNNLFSKHPNNLLFYQNDINCIKDNNDSYKIKISNDVMNTIADLLSKQNIKLIVLISPDKYDLYYPYIKNKNNFPKPEFFKEFNGLDKKYNYVNAYSTLSNEIIKTKNIYYYDDTHWSPIAAKIIANRITEIIK